MIRIKEIVKAFANLVGWENVAELEESVSGLYFQEAHPLLTLRAMRSIMPKDLADKYAPYEEGKPYSIGTKVSQNGLVYESLVDNNVASITDRDAWKEYDVLVDFLKRLTDIGIKKVVTRFLQDKTIAQETKTIVDRRALFDGAGRKEARVANDGRLVGFEITPLRDSGITTTLQKVGMQFVGNEGDIDLYLFHSSKNEPVATKKCHLTGDGSFAWFDLTEWVLPYVSEDTNAGGSWYVVYDQSKLPYSMEAINFGRDWSREPCGTCNKGDVQLYRLMSKFISFSPFYVATTEWDGKLWDVEDNIYSNANNFGLNFIVSMDCDLTDFIIREKREFASVLQMQVATEALRTLATNPDVDVNRVQANATRDNLLYETDGNGQGIKGLKGELEKAYKALSINTRGLDEVCLGCHNKGIRFGSI